MMTMKPRRRRRAASRIHSTAPRLISTRQPGFKQLAEQRADVDAGKKIARAAGTLVRAGVVPELGVIKSELHERGDGHRTTYMELVEQCHFRIQISEFRL